MTYAGIVYISNEIRYLSETAQQVNLVVPNVSEDAGRFINWFAEVPVGCATPVQTAVKNINVV